mmetsp:Transcript_20780/g.51532  ORF Transcript_20780/g.51532 Transcript_20780/m.51532 type:complete len:357 (-) Transcript_20780:288-1358(-)
MAWPWGGKITHAELATKFGWGSVIISTILFPLLFLWSRLLAFPIWLDWLGWYLGEYLGEKLGYEWLKGFKWLKSKPKFVTGNELYYRPKEGHSDNDNDDLFKKKFYEVAERVPEYPSGWNCHIDRDGGKFFESFFGLINCLDCEMKDDNGKCYLKDKDSHDKTDNGYLRITSNWSSWLRVSKVFVEFSIDTTNETTGKKGCYAHRIRFFFPLDGPNMYNPFTWVTIGFTVTAMTFFSKFSFRKWKRQNNVISVKMKTPKVKIERTDGSFTFLKRTESELRHDHPEKFKEFGSDSSDAAPSSSGNRRSISIGEVDFNDDRALNQQYLTNFLEDPDSRPRSSSAGAINETTPMLSRLL